MFLTAGQRKEFKCWQFQMNWLKHPLTHILHKDTYTLHRGVTVYLFNSPMFHLVPAGLSAWQTGAELGWTRASPNWLTHHSIKRIVCVCGDIMILYAALSKILYRTFLQMRCCLASFILIMYPPLLAWERAPPPPPPPPFSGSCICFVLILLMRETAIIAGASFDPQQTKTKKKSLSYVDSLLFLSLPSSSLGSSLASLTLKIRSVRGWGQWGCEGSMLQMYKSD